MVSSDHPAPAADDVRLGYLLSRLADAPDRRLRPGDLTKRLATKAGRELGITREGAEAVRNTSVADGYVRVEKAGRATWYQLTAAGEARLASLRPHLPAGPVVSRGRVIPPTNERVRRGRVAHLLMQLLEADDRTLTAAQANKPTARARHLELNAATAKTVRQDLANQGYLAITRDGRTERYTLTDAGLLHLGTLEFDDTFSFRLSGRALNALLEAARVAAKQFAVPEVPTGPALEEAVLSAFENLLRERHAVNGLVPIPEIRAAIRERFGPDAARHEVFDEVVLRLWRAKRVRMTAIADRGKATPQQLQDAIPGVGETLFYLEAARDAAAV